MRVPVYLANVTSHPSTWFCPDLRPFTGHPPLLLIENVTVLKTKVT